MPVFGRCTHCPGCRKFRGCPVRPLRVCSDGFCLLRYSPKKIAEKISRLAAPRFPIHRQLKHRWRCQSSAATQTNSAPEAIAVAVLTTLHGVGIPMASVILTAINPDKYTVLDYRALESLGVDNGPDSIDFYIAYLNACRELARRYGKTLRNLDRAMWQWSKERARCNSVGQPEHRLPISSRFSSGERLL